MHAFQATTGIRRRLSPRPEAASCTTGAAATAVLLLSGFTCPAEGVVSGVPAGSYGGTEYGAGAGPRAAFRVGAPRPYMVEVHRELSNNSLSYQTIRVDVDVDGSRGGGGVLCSGWLDLGAGQGRVEGPTLYGTGEAPTVAVSASGNRVVEVHRGVETDYSLFYSQGILRVAGGIDWIRTAQLFDDPGGDKPSIDITGTVVLEVHEGAPTGASAGRLLYRAGRLFESGQLAEGNYVAWAAAGPKAFANGGLPSVKVLEDYRVMVLHSDGLGNLLYSLGDVDPATLAVTWTVADVPYDTGARPSVVVANSANSRVVELHTRGEALLMRFGTLDGSSSIAWEGAACGSETGGMEYDTGGDPHLTYLGFMGDCAGEDAGKHLLAGLHASSDGGLVLNTFLASGRDWVPPMDRLAALAGTKGTSPAGACADWGPAVSARYGCAACNGAWHLCFKTVKEVLFPGTHNAVSYNLPCGFGSAGEDLCESQRFDVATQLASGIRFLDIDLCTSPDPLFGTADDPVECHTVPATGRRPSDNSFAQVMSHVEANAMDLVVLRASDLTGGVTMDNFYDEIDRVEGLYARLVTSADAATLPLGDLALKGDNVLVIASADACASLTLASDFDRCFSDWASTYNYAYWPSPEDADSNNPLALLTSVSRAAAARGSVPVPASSSSFSSSSPVDGRPLVVDGYLGGAEIGPSAEKITCSSVVAALAHAAATAAAAAAAESSRSFQSRVLAVMVDRHGDPDGAVVEVAERFNDYFVPL